MDSFTSMWAAPRRSILPRTLDRKLGGAKLPQTRGPAPPVRTRSTTPRSRSCWRRLGKIASSPRPALQSARSATATVCARFGFDCTIYMGKVDVERQALNVARMRFLGAKVVAVTAGQATLKEAVNGAMRDWVTNVRTTHYILGSPSARIPSR